VSLVKLNVGVANISMPRKRSVARLCVMDSSARHSLVRRVKMYQVESIYEAMARRRARLDAAKAQNNRDIPYVDFRHQYCRKNKCLECPLKRCLEDIRDKTGVGL